MPYDLAALDRHNQAEAATKAQKWAMATVGIVVEKTWLQVTLDGASMYTKELNSTLMPRAADESRPIEPMALIRSLWAETIIWGK